MGFERHQQVMHGAGFVGHRDDQAHAVLAAGGGHGQGLRQANHGKAGAVEGVILDGVRGGVQTKFAARALTGNGRPSRVGGSQTGAFGVAGGGAPLDMRQMGVEPALTLGQGLRVGVNRFNVVQRGRQAQQVVAHQNTGFAHHMQGRVEQQVE